MITGDGWVVSRAQRDAVTRGFAAVELDAAEVDIRMVGDFAGSVRQVLRSTTYSPDRGTGVVAGKTVSTDEGSVVLLNGPLFLRAVDALERIAAHEAGHVALNGRGEDVEARKTGHKSEWHDHLSYLAGTALEEARIERHLATRNYPLAGGAAFDHIATILHQTSVDLLELLVSPAAHAHPLHLATGVMGQADRLTKVLAYAAGFALEERWNVDELGAEGDIAVAGWNDYVAPTWKQRLSMYGELPPLTEAWTLAEWRRLVERVVELEHSAIRSMGFEFVDGPEGWGFVRRLNDEGWNARLDRARAQERIYDQEDNAS